MYSRESLKTTKMAERGLGSHIRQTTKVDMTWGNLIRKTTGSAERDLAMSQREHGFRGDDSDSTESFTWN